MKRRKDPQTPRTLLKQSIEQLKETLTVQEAIITLLLERNTDGVFSASVEDLDNALQRAALLKGSSEDGREVGIRIQYKPGHGPPSRLILPENAGRIH